MERFTEFSNILFLKVLSEIEDGKEALGLGSKIAKEYRWNYFKEKKGNELLSYVSDTVLKWFAKEYKDDTIFHGLKIAHPENLKEIIRLLDDLQLTDINADIKGDAFEYFIRSYSASNPSDLGEIFTPRHIVKTLVKLVNPKIGETVYDPFAGTGGMLIVAFKHILDGMAHTDFNKRVLKEQTLYGAELTRTASIAKMNMILAGDGHNNVVRQDSLANPVDGKYDVVITNFPFAQKTRYGDLYPIPNRNGDIICPQHCLRSVREGGRMAIIAPDGFLNNTNSTAYINVRQYLLENARLQSVVSLPRGAFEPYNRAKASILYFTDIKAAKTTRHFWYFNVKNDGYTLDKKRRRIDGANDLELVLSEKDVESQAEEYLLSLGIQRINMDEVRQSRFVMSAVPYIKLPEIINPKFKVLRIGDLLQSSGQGRVGTRADVPVMSITMGAGLIDQNKKFKKRIASANLANYKLVHRGELVMGFPIDEGLFGLQTTYEYAAVSPAYTIWKLISKEVDGAFLELLLRSLRMRSIYLRLMQGSVDRRRNIPDDIFLKIKVPIPSKAVQARVVEQYREAEELRAQAERLEGGIQKNIDSFWQSEAAYRPTERPEAETVGRGSAKDVQRIIGEPMKQAETAADATPFEKFQALARHNLATPKSELVKGEQKRKPTKARTKKRK